MDILFLDANVMFSAAYHRDAGLRRLWRLEDVELISSLYAVDEARRNLREPEQRIAWTHSSRTSVWLPHYPSDLFPTA